MGSSHRHNPQQGYHVKLTVHGEGSKGADTKHKVFWVESCPPEEPPGNGNGNGNGMVRSLRAKSSLAKSRRR